VAGTCRLSRSTSRAQKSGSRFQCSIGQPNPGKRGLGPARADSGNIRVPGPGARTTNSDPMQSPIASVSLQEFLEWEQGRTQRHELLHGRIIPFASTSFDDNHISDNVREALNRVLPSPCYAYGTDIISRRFLRRAKAVCARMSSLRARKKMQDAGRGRYLKHPSIVVEVRSASNSGKEWDAKLLEYWSTSSIGQLVVIETNERGEESYCRDADRVWQPPILSTLGNGVLVFPGVALEMTLDEVYRRTTLAAAE
jgi:Uma2 family endonuclease